MLNLYRWQRYITSMNSIWCLIFTYNAKYLVHHWNVYRVRKTQNANNSAWCPIINVCVPDQYAIVWSSTFWISYIFISSRELYQASFLWVRFICILLLENATTVSINQRVRFIWNVASHQLGWFSRDRRHKIARWLTRAKCYTYCRQIYFRLYVYIYIYICVCVCIYIYSAAIPHYL